MMSCFKNIIKQLKKNEQRCPLCRKIKDIHHFNRVSRHTGCAEIFMYCNECIEAK
jgi:hypothetical protein